MNFKRFYKTGEALIMALVIGLIAKYLPLSLIIPVICGVGSLYTVSRSLSKVFRDERQYSSFKSSELYITLAKLGLYGYGVHTGNISGLMFAVCVGVTAGVFLVCRGMVKQRSGAGTVLINV